MCEEIKACESEEDCLKCLPPLLPENEEIARVYQMAQNQLIMGANGPVDIQIDAIDNAMEHYMIDDRRHCRVLVMSTARYMIKKFHEEQEFKRKSKAKK